MVFRIKEILTDETMDVNMMNQAKSADRPAKVEFSSWDPYVNRK